MRLKLLNTLLLLVSIVFAQQLFSQGKLKGLVTDDYGQPAFFVNVIVDADKPLVTTTDFDGMYELEIPDSKKYNVTFSAIGKQSKVYSIQLNGGETFLLNVEMIPAVVQIGDGKTGPVIEGRKNRESDTYMETMRKKSGVSLDIMNQATLQKTGDTDVPSAVTRVPGVSTVGGYVSVRGLSDRYIKSTINGSTLPTLDPFTNNLRMDLFPTGMIDNIIITKSMTPDVPGDWAGAFLSIETKEYPSKLTVKFSTSFGYNTNATFQDVLTSSGSDTDWLGFDNGFRDIPDGVPTVQDNFQSPINPSLWQQFQHLGLQDDLYVYGITENSNITNGGIFHQVALNQLGLLGPAQFNNQIAVDNAISQYNNLYTDEMFFTHFNENLENIGTRFNNTWFTEEKRAPINFSQNLSIGNSLKVGKKKRNLGYVVGFRYSKNTQYDPTSVLNRTSLPASANSETNSILANQRDYAQKVSRETNGWSALANLSYELNKNNKISFLFMPNFRGQNKARKYEGLREDIFEVTLGDDQIYEERQQLVYQLETRHFFDSSGVKINFNASYTDGQRNVLDFKDMRYLWDGQQFLFNSTFNPDRRFRYMNEDLLDSRITIDVPAFKARKVPTHFKFGGSYQYNIRENQQVVYTVDGLNEDDLAFYGFDNVLSVDRFLIVDSTSFDLNYVNSSANIDSDIGFKHVTAGFAMIDYNYNSSLRLVGGLRVEHTDLLVDIRDFYDEDRPVDDDGRFDGNGQILNPGQIDQFSFLPSANLIYKLKDDERGLINLRLSYSQSLARPNFRELSNLSQFDYELRARVKGNSDLLLTSINNYDIRAESFFDSGTNLSVSLFYKQFDNHIELIQAQGNEFTWQNADNSEVFGLELEGKTNLSKNLELKANLTLIESQTTVTIPVEETRSMFGQAPYILNGILTYNLDTLGLRITASYNIQGPKLAVVASTGVVAPDVYEMPRNMLDMKVSKKLGDHFGVSLRARNILNAPIRRAYKFDSGYDLDFDNYVFGTTYILSFSYQI